MEEVTLEKFVGGFFRNLKCDISVDGDVLVVDNVPKSFEDIFGKAGPYRLSFKEGIEDTYYVMRGGSLFNAINRYLEGSGKTTLLKIDFDGDPLPEIEKALSLKNCDIHNILRKHRNNYFSRFTFSTNFRYLNEGEQVITEVYVHEGNVVEGDLSGYTVIEGLGSEASNEHLERDYSVAREFLKEKLEEKKKEIGSILKDRLEEEVSRINRHYEKQLGELGGDLNTQLEKIKETEEQMRLANDEELETLKGRLARLRKSLVKIGDDESKDRILKEQEFTVRDAQHKYSLNIDNKLINTTIIYYPVFVFDLFLKGEGSGRSIEMSYDPLLRTLNKIKCESCGVEVKRINLCSSGHISCDDCFGRCSECSRSFCEKCLKKSCSACGKPLCKNCAVMCMGCGKSYCKNHMRKDCVSGEERCVNCLRACMRCHGMAEEKHFGEALDGSKVCQKCLGEERRNKVMKSIFRD